MELRTDSRDACAPCFSRLTIGSPRLPSCCEFAASSGIRALPMVLYHGLRTSRARFRAVASYGTARLSGLALRQPGRKPIRSALSAKRLRPAAKRAAAVSAAAVRSATALRAATLFQTSSTRLLPIPSSRTSRNAAAPVQALSAQDLEQLLAPIALYPDALLAQILAASTYPAQVAVADQWLDQMRAQGYGSPDQIAAGAQAHDHVGSERQGAHRIPRRARHAGPQPGVDHQPRQRLLQPAAGCDANRPGAAPARRAGRQPAKARRRKT